MRSTLFNKLDVESAKAFSNMFLNNKAMSKKLLETMVEAKNSSRLVCGIYEAGKVLQSNSEDCALCVIPTRDVDFLLHIHITLIEAFCFEAGIKVIKVDSLSSLKGILGEFEIAPSDYNCLLIQHCNVGISSNLHEVLKFSELNENIVKLEE